MITAVTFLILAVICLIIAWISRTETVTVFWVGCYFVFFFIGVFLIV